MTDDEGLAFLVKVNEAFTPSAPINNKDLFAGRRQQIARVMGAIMQRGQHAIIYGERGVGKTSFSNILFDLMVMAGKSTFQVARFNCNISTDFDCIWRACLKQLVTTNGDTVTLDSFLAEAPGPENVCEVFQRASSPAIVVIDEIDRILNPETSALIADTVKTLSDHSVNATLILVGVADSVEQLIAEHHSIERNLVQIQMPRMSDGELTEIIDKGLAHCEMTIDEDVKFTIARLSQGLPPYTHQLGLYSALSAIRNKRTAINSDDLAASIADAVINQQQTIISTYERATHSPRENLYKQVLLACALAPANELGYFTAGDLRPAMKRIMGKPYEIPAFSRHLNDFCETSRGPVLHKTGASKRFRFRFINPLMEPFVLIKGISGGLLTQEQVSELSSIAPGRRA